jgi:hypothetical protein
MELLLPLIAVLILAWINEANEDRLARKVRDRMDKVMGRED